MTVKELTAVMVFMGSVISGFVWLDNRHEPAGAVDVSRIQAEIYALDLTIADLTSTISRYNVLEESGTLSDANRARRTELSNLRANYIQERRLRQERLNSQ